VSVRVSVITADQLIPVTNSPICAGGWQVGAMGARKPLQPTEGQCALRATSASCFHGWKNFFAAGRRNTEGDRALTPGFEFMV
jgi:hypothetical protein